ncbi:hypothetical protein [Entomomonas asaccharolytica]|uniref:7(1) septoil knot domain-containing protein n=1 Tax=Entomomonas asaccharolytica TaxID=2785331 RepID=A0A974RXI8_9GAMM|nr:hypothetical protein [Entomomonas asaccharolytica]QQP86316.1 hypothetical protein JHT90_03480 [Entomomonas asaccharolytica]
MKKLFLLSGLMVILANFSTYTLAAGIDKERCTFNDIPLYGKVKIVDSDADITVQRVETAADIDIKLNDSPAHCGEWHFVEQQADFTIEYVPDGADIKIREVDIDPGIKQLN